MGASETENVQPRPEVLCFEGGASSAFVLMHFEPELDRVYAEVILSTLQSAGYDVSRADSTLDQRNILKDIVRGIAEADLVVAEATDANANVMYEVGLAHALLKPTVLLTQDVNSLPFDLRAYRAIGYSTQYDDVDRLRRALREIGVGLRHGSIIFENPVTDFAPEVTSPSVALLARFLGLRRPNLTIDEVAHKAEPYLRLVHSICSLYIAVTEFRERVRSLAAKYKFLREQVGASGSQEARDVLSAIVSEIGRYVDVVKTEMARFVSGWLYLARFFETRVRAARVTNKKERELLARVRSGLADVRVALSGLLERTQGGLLADLPPNGAIDDELAEALRSQAHGMVVSMSADLASILPSFSRLLDAVDQRLDPSSREPGQERR